MKFSLRKYGVALLFLLVAASGALATGLSIVNMAPFHDATGVVRTFNTQGAIDLSNPFFQRLGTNDRSCDTCHQASDGWTVTPAHIQQRFEQSQGLDPIFRTNDGSDCPSADVSTVDARRQAYSMLLNKGLIRVSMGVPANAEFSITSIDDPHRCADTTAAALALFRRPLPACNLPFLTTVMWDGRETFGGQSLEYNLGHQAVDATNGHAAATSSPSQHDVDAIVAFEMANFTAQSIDNHAHNLASLGATGGPHALSQQEFYPGINDPLGRNPTGAAFVPFVFTLFDTWELPIGREHVANEARAQIARGEDLFNTLPITISGVTGLNDQPGIPAELKGTCSTCHDTPNVGNHSVPLPINIGVADYPAAMSLDVAGLPVYTIRCDATAATPIGTGRVFQTTDPGRALITGKCADVGKMKGPVLRGLAARAPYFHNGSAHTLRDVVNFYNERFNINMTADEKNDLVAFLQAL